MTPWTSGTGSGGEPTVRQPVEALVLVVANTRDGLAAARTRGWVGGCRPKLTPAQAVHAQQLYDAGGHTVQQIADLLTVPRSTIYGHLAKATIGQRPTVAGVPEGP